MNITCEMISSGIQKLCCESSSSCRLPGHCLRIIPLFLMEWARIFQKTCANQVRKYIKRLLSVVNHKCYSRDAMTHFAMPNECASYPVTSAEEQTPCFWEHSPPVCRTTCRGKEINPSILDGVDDIEYLISWTTENYQRCFPQFKEISISLTVSISNK